MWNIEFNLIIGVINLMVGMGLLFAIVEDGKKKFKENYNSAIFWCTINLILAPTNLYLYYIGS